MKPRLIGITGPAGSGKDTVANFLVREFGYSKFSFAAALKDVLAALFSWDRSLLEGDTEESRVWRDTEDAFWSAKFESKFTPRIAMQTIGTDLFRKLFNDDIWIYALENKLNTAFKESTNVVITDVRFPNEIKLVKTLNGLMFEVSSGTTPKYYELAKWVNTTKASLDVVKKQYPDVHESEYAWIGINSPDHLIRNDGTIEELDFYMIGLMTQPQYQ